MVSSSTWHITRYPKSCRVEWRSGQNIHGTGWFLKFHFFMLQRDESHFVRAIWCCSFLVKFVYDKMLFVCFRTQAMDDHHMLDILPFRLRAEIAKHIHLETLQKVCLRMMVNSPPLSSHTVIWLHFHTMYAHFERFLCTKSLTLLNILHSTLISQRLHEKFMSVVEFIWGWCYLIEDWLSKLIRTMHLFTFCCAIFVAGENFWRLWEGFVVWTGCAAALTDLLAGRLHLQEGRDRTRDVHHQPWQSRGNKSR